MYAVRPHNERRIELIRRVDVRVLGPLCVIILEMKVCFVKSFFFVQFRSLLTEVNRMQLCESSCTGCVRVCFAFVFLFFLIFADNQ